MGKQDVLEVTKFTWDVLSFWFADRGSKGNPLFVNEDAMPELKRPCATFALIEGPQMMINDKSILVLKATPQDIIDKKTYKIKPNLGNGFAMTKFEKNDHSKHVETLNSPHMSADALLRDFTHELKPTSDLGKAMYDPHTKTVKKPWA